MAAKTPKNAAEAVRLIEQADPTTREGREQIRAVAKWVREDPDRVSVDIEAQVREAEREASSEGAKAFWRKPLEQVQWLLEKNESAGNAIIRAVESFVAAAGETNIGAPASGGSREGLVGENELIRIAWERMTPEERTEAFNRGMVPSPGSGWMPGPPTPGSAADPLSRPVDDVGLTRGQQADAARLEAQRGRDVPAVGEPSTASAAGGPVSSNLTPEQQGQVDSLVASGVFATEEEALAALGLEDVDPLLGGVDEDFVAFRDPSRFDALSRGDAASARRFEAQAAAAGRPVGTPLYRGSHAQRMIDRLAASSPPEIKRLQEQLVKAGLLAGDFGLGWMDEPTKEAVRNAMGAANMRGINVFAAIDQLTQTRAEQREQDRAEALAAFTPRPFRGPDPDTLAARARQALLAIGRRASEIDDDEIAQMVSVMSGDYKRAHQMEQELARREHIAAVENQFAEDDAALVQPDMTGIAPEHDPEASFTEWFQKAYAGEIETREAGEEGARRGRNFTSMSNSMAAQVSGGGA